MVIDTNIYWIPEALFADPAYLEEFLQTFPQSYDVHAYVRRLEDGRQQIVVETPTGYPGVNYTEGEYTLDGQLADMDLAGVEQGILKLPCCQEWMSLPLCRRFNDEMARHAAASGGRLHALAVIPPLGGAAALRELERCVKELGMTGVQLSAHYGNHYLDEEIFAPFFEKMNELGLTAYVHHTPVPAENASLLAYTNLRRSYGRCADQMIAVCRELFSGMFSRYPRVKLVHSMMGGGFPLYLNMMLPKPGGARDARFESDTGAYYDYLGKNLFFELSHAQPWGKDVLETAVRSVGADHLIYGSSYPVKKQEWMLHGPECIRALALSRQEQEMLLAENARRVYNLV